MAENDNATCSICGKGYHVCLSCKDAMTAEPWKLHTCTSEHFKIFQVIHGFSTGVYDKREAKARLKNVDLSDLDELRDNIKKTIKDIMDEPKRAKVAHATTSAPAKPVPAVKQEPKKVCVEGESKPLA